MVGMAVVMIGSYGCAPQMFIPLNLAVWAAAIGLSCSRAVSGPERTVGDVLLIAGLGLMVFALVPFMLPLLVLNISKLSKAGHGGAKYLFYYGGALLAYPPGLILVIAGSLLAQDRPHMERRPVKWGVLVLLVVLFLVAYVIQEIITVAHYG
jgi:hypothetical protein